MTKEVPIAIIGVAIPGPNIFLSKDRASEDLAKPLDGSMAGRILVKRQV